MDTPANLAPCPRCQTPTAGTLIPHPLRTLRRYPTCRACTLANLEDRAHFGTLVMSCYASQADCEQDRWSHFYLSRLHSMTYTMECKQADWDFQLLRHHEPVSLRHDNAHVEFWNALTATLYALFQSLDHQANTLKMT